MEGFCMPSWELSGVRGLQIMSFISCTFVLCLYKESFERRVLKRSRNGI